MLINIFGKWINPSRITRVVGLPDTTVTNILFESKNDIVSIKGKTETEVVNEINKYFIQGTVENFVPLQQCLKGKETFLLEYKPIVEIHNVFDYPNTYDVIVADNEGYHNSFSFGYCKHEISKRWVKFALLPIPKGLV
jgi:uncharacterized protein YlzI (FlbEa/FlbD family)